MVGRSCQDAAPPGPVTCSKNAVRICAVRMQRDSSDEEAGELQRVGSQSNVVAHDAAIRPGAVFPGSGNKAELRAAMRFQEKIRNAAAHAAALAAPPPMHEFSYEPKGHSTPSFTGTKPGLF